VNGKWRTFIKSTKREMHRSKKKIRKYLSWGHVNREPIEKMVVAI